MVLKFRESADSGCAWLETTVAGSYTSAIPEPPAPAPRQDRSTSPGLPFDDSRLLHQHSDAGPCDRAPQRLTCSKRRRRCRLILSPPPGRHPMQKAAIYVRDPLPAPGSITILTGKNQPEPRTVAVISATARALTEIRPVDPTGTTPVFGLTGEALPTGSEPLHAPPASGMDSPAGSAWRGGWSPQERPTLRYRTKAGGNTGIWCTGTREGNQPEKHGGATCSRRKTVAPVSVYLSQNWTILEPVTWFTSHQKRLPPYTRCGTKTRTMG